LWPSV